MGDLLAGYTPVAAFDELFAAPEEPRRHALALHDALQTLSPADFADRCAAHDRAFRDQGITFQLSGEERPFPLDLVPRIIPADEWSVIEQAVCASASERSRRSSPTCTAAVGSWPTGSSRGASSSRPLRPVGFFLLAGDSACSIDTWSGPSWGCHPVVRADSVRRSRTGSAATFDRTESR